MSVTPAISEEDLLRNLILLEKIIQEKERLGHPGTYGMPDLLYPKGYAQGVQTYNEAGLHTSAKGEDFPDGWTREPLGYEETDQEYAERQNKDLIAFIESTLYVVKDGKRRYIRIISVLKPFICDVFFLRTTKVIVWKPRGGGGSLGASVLIWLLLVYRKRSVLDIAGSGEQSKVVYHYVCQFWECIPGLSDGLLDKDPLKEETRLKTGISLYCILPGTEIFSNDGLKKIEDIKVGDKVLSKDGVFNTVTNTVTTEKSEDCIELNVVGSPSVRVTKDHKIWAVKLTDEQKRLKRAYGWNHFDPNTLTPEWVEAQDLDRNDLVYFPRFKSEDKPESLSWNRYIDGRGKFSADLDSDVYRLLGYWLADGSKSKTHVCFFFGLHEKEYAEDVKDIMSRVFNTKACIFQIKNVWCVNACNIGLCRWMKDFGAKEDKSIPLSLLENASEEQLKNLIVGMIRGDGCITQSKTTESSYYKSECSYSTISPRIAQTLFLASSRLGLTPSIQKYLLKDSTFDGKNVQRKPLYKVRFSGNDAVYVSDIIGVPFKSKTPIIFRKTALITDDSIFRPVRSVKSVFYEGDVYDLTVENNHSFCAPYVSFSNCKPGTEKQVRGKHMSVLAIDEVCQEDARVESAFLAALQTVISEEDSIVLLFSTFHLPSGLFQEYWDNAEEKGFTRVKWNVFDTMAPCTRGLEEATVDDPKALCYCEKCELTAPDFVLDDRGNKKQVGWKWCYGKARESEGWESFDKIVKAMRMNIGTEMFDVEFCCSRPNYSNSIYGPELVEAALTDPLPIEDDDEINIGIDWGYQTKNSLAISVVIRKIDRVYIHDCVFLDHKLVSDVVLLLNEWTEQFGKPFRLFCDRSHHFNNADLVKAGYDVIPVDFGTYKNIGIANITKYMVFRRLNINSELDALIKQLKAYRADKSGKAVKKEDHGPDSVMCAMLAWKFEELFGEDAFRVSLDDIRLKSEEEAMRKSKKLNMKLLFGDNPIQPVVPRPIGRPNVLA